MGVVLVPGKLRSDEPFLYCEWSAGVKHQECGGGVVDAQKATYQNVHPGETNESLVVSSYHALERSRHFNDGLL